MKMVLKAKKETPDTTPLSKIKAKAVFEGQEAGAERHLRPEKSTVTHFSLALAPGTAVATRVPLEKPPHGETVSTTTTSSNSPTTEKRMEKIEGNTLAVFAEDQGVRVNQHQASSKSSAQDTLKVNTAPGTGEVEAALQSTTHQLPTACFALCQPRWRPLR